MTFFRKTALCLTLASLTLGAYAQTNAEHTQHHPAASVKNAPKAAAPTPQPEQVAMMAGMDKQMESMRKMHEKMVAAKSPEERNALMGEHMKSMKDGMSMMGDVGSMGMSGMDKNTRLPMDMATRQMMMEKRMDMMQGMMQMMMDSMPVPAAK